MKNESFQFVEISATLPKGLEAIELLSLPPKAIVYFYIPHFTFYIFGLHAFAQTLQVVTKTIEKTFTADRYPKVQVWGERSDIDIVPWGRNDMKAVIELTAKHPDRSTAEKDLETLHFTAEKSGRTVSLHNFVVLTKNRAKPQSNLKAHFTLFVPVNCAVEIKNSFGKITVKGLQTIMQLQAEFCTVELTDLRGTLTARTQFGALKADNLSGTLSFITERTDLLIQQIKGECRVRAQYGSLDIQTDKSQVKLDVETKNTELRNGTTVAKH